MTTYTGPTLAATMARNVSSAGTFTAQTRDVWLPVPILLESYTLDIFRAGTYRLAVDGVTVAGPVVVPADNTNGVVLTLDTPLEVSAGKHTISVACTSGAVRWHYHNVSTQEPTGTGGAYLGTEQWQEATGNQCPGTYSFKAPDGVLKDVLTSDTQSAASFTQQEWPVTFTDDVLLVGVGKKAYQNDATGYTLSVDGVDVATVVKPNSQTVVMAYPVSPAHPMAAGSRTLKVVAGSGVNKSWSYKIGGGGSPVGDGYVTTWGAWVGNSPQQPGARLFYALATDTPTGLTVDPGAFTADVSWTAPAGGGVVEGYEIRVDGGTPVDVGNVLTYEITGLTPATGYTVEVRAYGAWDTGAWAGPEPFTTDTAGGPAYYRVRVDIREGTHVYDVLSDDDITVGGGDTGGYGVMLPITLGWNLPDSDGYPGQADPTTLAFRLLVPDPSAISTVQVGVAVEFTMWVDPDPAADPWQLFHGIITQVDGARTAGGDFMATVYCADRTMELASLYCGYTANWPIEQIADRIDRILAEAGLPAHDDGTEGGPHGLGMVGWLPARTAGQPVSVLSAIKAALKDAADEYDSEPPDIYYGRYTFTRPAPADGDGLVINVFRRRMFDDGFSTVTLAGEDVYATSDWSRPPTPVRADWVIVDGTEFGTPTPGVPPYVRDTSLVDYFGDPPGSEPNYSATERDSLGESLLPDGSTLLEGWWAQELRYDAAASLPVAELVTMWASWAPITRAVGVVVDCVRPELDLEGEGFLAGMLVGARLTIPPGGRYHMTLRLRAERLAGMELPT